MQNSVASIVRRELSIIPEIASVPSHGGKLEAHAQERQQRKELQGLQRYFDEQPLPERHGLWVSLAAAWSTFDWFFSVPKTDRFTPEADVLPVEKILGRHRDDVDALSIHYTGLHRASVLLLFLFGVLAVLFAGLAADTHTAAHDEHKSSAVLLGVMPWSTFFCAAELTCLTMGVWLFTLNTLGGWQERATDYRLLAERLRHAAALSVLGRATWQYAYEPLPAHYSAHNPRSGWVDCMFRALIRQAVLPLGTRNLAENEYTTTCRRHLINFYLGSQIDYHRRNAAKLHRQHFAVEVVAYTALILTFAACLLHFVWHAPFLTVVATTLPAIVAASHGFSAHFHLQRVLARSEAMERRLAEHLAKAHLIPTAQSSHAVAIWVEEAADLMLQEADEWRVVFRLLNVPTPG